MQKEKQFTSFTLKFSKRKMLELRKRLALITLETGERISMQKFFEERLDDYLRKTDLSKKVTKE